MRYIPPPVENSDRSLSIDITPSEEDLLNWIANKLEMTPQELLESFVGDLCSSCNSGGSDERAFAFNWLKRRFIEVPDDDDYYEAIHWRRAEESSQ